MNDAIKKQIEQSYEACQMTEEELYADLKRSLRRRLDELGLVVSFPKNNGSDKVRELVNFNVDSMLSFTEIRNGLIRNKSQFKREVEGKRPAKVEMELVKEFGLSYLTIRNIRCANK